MNAQASDTDYNIAEMRYEALKKLDSFYSNPNYLRHDENNEKEESLQDAFATILQYAVDNNQLNDTNDNSQLFGGKKSSDWGLIFKNYLNLCRYYKESGNVGFDSSVLKTALEKENDILREYEETESRVYLEQDSDVKDLIRLEAEGVLNTASSSIIQDMIQKLNIVPQPELWSDMSKEEKMAVEKMFQDNYFPKLYQLYRISTGKVNVMELAVIKLTMNFMTLCVLALLLAAFVDILTVILTLTKSVNAYKNSLPRYKKIVYRMFIQDEISDVERLQAKRRKLAGGTSVAIGLLLFGVYYKISDNREQGAFTIITLISLVCLFALVAFLVVNLYEKTHRDSAEWKREGLYTKLKNIWSLPTQNDSDLESIRGKICDAVKNNKTMTIDQDSEKLILDLFSEVEIDDQIKVLKPEVRLLFSKIESLTLNRMTLEYHLISPGKSLGRDYVQGWNDKKDFSCIRMEEVKKAGMAFSFAVLRGEGLVDYSEVSWDGDDEINHNSSNNIKYYILSKKFLDILYGLMMETASGTTWEDDSSLADNLTDILEEEDIDNI